jgi:hypothetical protein
MNISFSISCRGEMPQSLRLQVFGRPRNTSERANRPTPASARNLPLLVLAEAAPFGCQPAAVFRYPFGRP